MNLQPGLDPNLISAALQRRQNGNIRMDAGAPVAPGGAPAGGPMPPGMPTGPAGPEMSPTGPMPPGGTPEQVNPDIAGVQAANQGASIPDDIKMIAKVLITKLTKLL